MTKHTPGPWVVNTDDPTCHAIGSEDYGRIALLHDPLAEELQRADQHEADARLMAAAPDLLEAAEEAARWWGNQESLDSAPWIYAIREAIARAKGEDK